MIIKQAVFPERIRKVPKQFSWIDHRLVRDGHIRGMTHAGAALYLFLTAVSDKEGLSYYSDASIEKFLSIEHASLEEARENLICSDLVAYKKPIYQVLELNSPQLIGPKREIVARGGEPLSLEEILRRAMEAGS